MEPWITADPAIDEQLSPKMQWAQERKAEAQQLALDATRILSCTEERLELYKSQRFFSRCWSALTGKTHAAQQANQTDLLNMQKRAWRYINMLNERDLMTADAILTVKNNLLTLAVKESETRQALESMARRVLDRFHRLEERVDRLEQSDKLNRYLLTIESYDYDERFTPHLRMLRVLKDFSDLKTGEWDAHEIRCFHTALKLVGLPWKQPVSLHDFLHQLANEVDQVQLVQYSELVQVGTNGSSVPNAYILENVSAPAFSSLYLALEVYETSSPFAKHLESRGHLNVDRCEALRDFLESNALSQGIDLNAEIPLRDLGVELLHSRWLTAQLYQSVGSSAGVSSMEDVLETMSGNMLPVTNPTEESEKDAIVQSLDPHRYSDYDFGQVRKLAEQGDADAQFELAIRYQQGTELARNESLCLDYLKQAAEAKHPDASLWLAEVYLNGDLGVNADNEAFRRLIEEARRVGRPEAHIYLGRGSEDPEEKRSEYRKAIALGYKQAHYWLGRSYFPNDPNEDVQPKMLESALSEWNEGCKPPLSDCDPLCSMALGSQYLNGNAVLVKNPAKGLEYLNAAYEGIHKQVAQSRRISGLDRSHIISIANALADVHLFEDVQGKDILRGLELKVEVAELGSLKGFVDLYLFVMRDHDFLDERVMKQIEHFFDEERLFELLSNNIDYSGADDLYLPAALFIKGLKLEDDDNELEAIQIYRDLIPHTVEKGPGGIHWGLAAFAKWLWMSMDERPNELQAEFPPEVPFTMMLRRGGLISSDLDLILDGSNLAWSIGGDVKGFIDLRERVEFRVESGILKDSFYCNDELILKATIIGQSMVEFLERIAAFCRQHRGKFDT